MIDAQKRQASNKTILFAITFVAPVIKQFTYYEK